MAEDIWEKEPMGLARPDAGEEIPVPSPDQGGTSCHTQRGALSKGEDIISGPPESRGGPLSFICFA